VTSTVRHAARFELTDLLHRYAQVIDNRRWEEISALFTPDGEADYGELGGLCQGPEAIARHCQSVLERFSVTQHFIANVTVECSAEEGTATCSFLAVHVRRDDRPPFVVGGTYEDALVATSEGWRIHRRKLIPLWTTGGGRSRSGASRGTS
jgi:3-phenylpropionate/cinnamic acid dioxygenase small subunit